MNSQERYGVHTENIVDIDVATEMEGSFLEYAYSVIYARALPDARDGLKPVQRRILFQMAQMGLRPERPYVKSARVVGEVMGKLHPHGDVAIYEAMVRLAQAFSQRLPTLDGHGNFGSLDDGPAAPRYTEIRLAAPAIAMTNSLDEDVVDFVPNYDSKLTQPEVLPAAIPGLLVNGAAGIAVGMATNMPPHNLVEVIAAARYLLAHPAAGLDEIMRFVPGPDLPTGGKIVGLDGIRDAYATGRGTFRTRATTRIEHTTARKRSIIVTELPYLVGPERVIDKIKEAVTARKVTGISDVIDLTDNDHGLRLQIDIKSGFDPEVILGQLYRLTPLEDSFGINNVALVEGQPRTLGLLELLRVWVEHRLDVTRRRSQFRLNKASERLHLVDGLLVAIADIDEVIQVIRTSEDAAAARERLQSVFDLSQAQAEYILELRLRRLTRYSRLELETEREQLRASIEALGEILGSDARLRDLVSQEMAQIAAEHGTARRTILLESSALPVVSAASSDAEVEDAPCTVLVSATGLVARTSGEVHPAPPHARLAHDVLAQTVATSTRSQVGIVTSSGRLVHLAVVDLPALAPAAAASVAGGSVLAEAAHLEAGEQVCAVVSLADTDPPITMVTATGVVKRLARGPVKDGQSIMALRPGDEVIAAFTAADDDFIVIVTAAAQLLRFAGAKVRPQQRGGAGMAGIATDDKVIWAGAVPAAALDNAQLVTVAGRLDQLPETQSGFAKVTALAAFPVKGRATAGVRCHRFARGTQALLAAWAGPGPAKASGSGGQPVQLPAPDPRRDGSGTALAAPAAAMGR